MDGLNSRECIFKFLTFECLHGSLQFIAEILKPLSDFLEKLAGLEGEFFVFDTDFDGAVKNLHVDDYYFFFQKNIQTMFVIAYWFSN